jgi:hypothetical protein
MLAYGREVPDPAPETKRRVKVAPPIPDPDRHAAIGQALARTGLAPWSSNLTTVRGKCRTRRCACRWGIVRVTLDFRPVAIERYAAIECARCARVWRRVPIRPLRDRRGLQTVAVTAILPASVTRWFARGRWHRDGDDALVVAECSLADLDEAARAHRKLADRVAIVKARRAAVRAEREHQAGIEMRALMARLAEMDAAREADEAAATAREAA